MPPHNYMTLSMAPYASKCHPHCVCSWLCKPTNVSLKSHMPPHNYMTLSMAPYASK